MMQSGLQPGYPDHAPVPRVSIIIPAYNVSQYIGEALDSVFAQTFQDFEAIVINDGSPDTAELERAIEPYRSRVVYISQSNRGLAAARNTGIAAARGELLALLDADDAWHAEFLEKQVPLFAADPKLAVLWCDGLGFGEGPGVGHRCMEYCPSTRPVTTEALLLGRTFPLTIFTVVRRQVVLDVGGFDERFRRAEDFDLWLRISHAGYKLDFQETVLGRRRIRPDSLSASACLQLQAGIEVVRKFSSAVGKDDPRQATAQEALRRLRSDLDLARGRAHIAAGEFRMAGEAYRLANAYRKRPDLRIFAALLSTFPAAACWMHAVRRKLLEKLG